MDREEGKRGDKIGAPANMGESPSGQATSTKYAGASYPQITVIKASGIRKRRPFELNSIDRLLPEFRFLG